MGIDMAHGPGTWVLDINPSNKMPNEIHDFRKKKNFLYILLKKPVLFPNNFF